MTKKGYNPKAWEPDAHEKFAPAPPEVIEAYRKAIRERIANQPAKYTYDMIQDARDRGESHNVAHYAYEMQFDVYVGIEDELVEGSIDSHLHIYPDYVPRSNDIIELAIECSKAKMRAIVCKDHFFTNIGGAWGAQWVVDEMVRKGELEQACQVFGTHILCWSHHPDQIHLIRKYPNLGAVFFWTQSGGGKFCGPDLQIVDERGRLVPEVKDCIKACADYKIPIMTGHKSYDLVLPMVQYASEVGAHILVTHASTYSGAPLGVGAGGTVEQCKELARLGAYLECNGNKVLPSIIWPIVDPNITLDWIAQVGPDHVVANSDHGQPFCGDALECWSMFIRAMLHYGLDKEFIKTITATNPAKYLYLDD